MTEADRDAALVAFIHNFPAVAKNVESSARQIEAVARSQRALEGKVDGVVQSQKTLEGKVDGMARVQETQGKVLETHGKLMTTLNADQAQLRREVRAKIAEKIAEVRSEVRGKLADVLDEADVAEIATGAHKAIKAEEAVAKLAKIEADAEREKEKVRDERRRMAYTVAGSIVAGVVLLVVGGWIGHSVGRGTTPASAATGVGASTASVVRPAVLHRPAATTSTSE